jgi:hypothetical protein
LLIYDIISFAHSCTCRLKGYIMWGISLQN